MTLYSFYSIGPPVAWRAEVFFKKEPPKSNR
jgi:hypothetical protein